MTYAWIIRHRRFRKLRKALRKAKERNLICHIPTGNSIRDMYDRMSDGERCAAIHLAYNGNTTCVGLCDHEISIELPKAGYNTIEELADAIIARFG